MDQSELCRPPPLAPALKHAGTTVKYNQSGPVREMYFILCFVLFSFYYLKSRLETVGLEFGWLLLVNIWMESVDVLSIRKT